MTSRRLHRLKAHRQRVRKSLPKVEHIIRASLIVRYKVCGKKTCKCTRGERHGPHYYLSITHPKGEKEMVYVPAGRKGEVASFIKNYKKLKQGLKKISQTNIELLKSGFPLR